MGEVLVTGLGLMLAAACVFGLSMYRVIRRDSSAVVSTLARLESARGLGAHSAPWGPVVPQPAQTGGTSSSKIPPPSRLDAVGDPDPVAEADVYLAYDRDQHSDGVDADVTYDRASAMHALKRYRPDLVLLDHDLPDVGTLVEMYSKATVAQGDALRQAVGEVTLNALQGRELTLPNIRTVLKTVTQATSAGAAQNPASAIDVETLLDRAFAGMDAALLQAVAANRKALQRFVDQGVNLEESQLKSALANLKMMETVLFTTVAKAAQGAGGPLQAPWEHVLEAMKIKGTDTGAQAASTVDQLLAQGKTAILEGREIGAPFAQTLRESYATLVSGVLIGMSEGLQQGAALTPSGDRSRKK